MPVGQWMELPSSMPGAISVDELEPAVDNILPRGPLLDTFIRKYDIGTDSVDYRLPTPLPGLAFPTDFPFREYDAMVDAKLAERPDIGAWMKTSFVKVIVASRDRETGELGFSVASGCQITPSHVLTCRHVFEMPASHEFQDIGIMASHNITVSADLLDLSSIVSTPPNTYMLRAGGCSSFRWHGSSKGLDFVVLQSREVLPSLSNTFLRIPKESHWTAGSTFCALGYAGRPDYVTAEKCFTEPFIEYITRLSGKGQTEILPPFLEASCYGWQFPLAFFGSAMLPSRVSSGYYGVTDMSLTFGASGGPIVALDYPDELVGLVVGAHVGEEGSFFLDAQAPVVKEAYQHCVNLTGGLY